MPTKQNKFNSNILHFIMKRVPTSKQNIKKIYNTFRTYNLSLILCIQRLEMMILTPVSTVTSVSDTI